MKFPRVLSLLVLAVGLAASAAEEASDAGFWDRAYAGAAGGALLPGGDTGLRCAADVAVRGGWYLSDAWALEGEALCAPNVICRRGGNETLSGGALRAVWHLTGWETYDKLFGSERLDFFATLGAAGCGGARHAFADGSHRTAFGPEIGLGAFYHLTERWSVRADARALLACDTPCGMVYGVSFGLQYALGGD